MYFKLIICCNNVFNLGIPLEKSNIVLGRSLKNNSTKEEKIITSK